MGKRPVPVPGARAQSSFMRCMNERAWRTGGCCAHGAALRSLRIRQIATPVTRHARCRAAERLEQIEPARPARQSFAFGSFGVTRSAETPALKRWAGAFAQPLRQASCHSAHRAPGPSSPSLQPSSPVQPTALPPVAPPSFMRGTDGGIFNAVGRETGSSLRLPVPAIPTPPISNLFP